MTVTWYVSLIINTPYGSVATVYWENRASCSETLSLFVLNIHWVPPDRSRKNIIHLAAVWTVRLIKKELNLARHDLCLRSHTYKPTLAWLYESSGFSSYFTFCCPSFPSLLLTAAALVILLTSSVSPLRPTDGGALREKQGEV